MDRRRGLKRVCTTCDDHEPELIPKQKRGCPPGRRKSLADEQTPQQNRRHSRKSLAAKKTPHKPSHGADQTPTETPKSVNLWEGWEERMRIVLKTLTGVSLTLLVKSTDTVGSIKRKVLSHEGVPLEFLGLIYSGMQLEDSHTLADYHVEKDSILDLVLRLRSRQVFVRNFLSGVSLAIDVNFERDTVSDLKKMVEGKHNIRREAFRLIYRGKALEDARLLKDYGMVHEDLVWCCCLKLKAS